MVIGGACLLLAGIVLLALLVGGSDDDSAASTRTPSHPATESPTPVTASLSASPRESLALYARDLREGTWAEGDVVIRPSTDESKVVFLLRLEGTEPGADYEIDLGLVGCAKEESGPFYFGVALIEDGIFNEPPGPGRARPDILAAMPAELVALGEGEVAVWGAALRDLSYATGRASCPQSPVLTLKVAARSGSISIAWATQIISDGWLTTDPLAVPVAVAGVGETTLTLAPRR